MTKPVTYVVLVGGRYNNERGKAGDYSEGDPLTTRPAYGSSLATGGLVVALGGAALVETPSSGIGGVVLPAEEMLPVDFLTEAVGLSDSALLNLKTAGFRTIADMKGASDKELLSIVGIGPATLAKIRAHFEDMLENEYLGMLEESNV